jgi:ABC-2 type transport system ATP-binding protein
MATPAGDPILKTERLSKTYRPKGRDPVQAVQSLDLTLHTGEIFGLLGPNGAGKTTAISMISGLLSPTSGDAFIGGLSISREPLKAKALLGVVPQEIALYPELTARQNLEFFGRMTNLNGAVLTRRVDEVLDFIDLTDRQNDRVSTFSGGMKRRVNLGIGLTHEPKLLFMDEPTVGIDPQTRRRILDTVVRLKHERGMTVLYTSHLMEEVQEISDRVGIIDHGRLIALGTVGELVQQIGEEDRITFRLAEAPPEALTPALQAIDGVSGVTIQQDDDRHSIVIFARRGRRALPGLLQASNDLQVNVTSVEVREPDLEAVFLNLTGRELRE